VKSLPRKFYTDSSEDEIGDNVDNDEDGVVEKAKSNHHSYTASPVWSLHLLSDLIVMTMTMTMTTATTKKRRRRRKERRKERKKERKKDTEAGGSGT
jgi:hypothetical protein